MPSIPWVDISAFLHNFYDTDQFKFSVALWSPDLYEAVDIYSVTKYLIVLASTKTPFHFHSKEDITRLTAKQTNAVIEDLMAGEDCDADEAISNMPCDDELPPFLPHTWATNLTPKVQHPPIVTMPSIQHLTSFPILSPHMPAAMLVASKTQHPHASLKTLRLLPIRGKKPRQKLHAPVCHH